MVVLIELPFDDDEGLGMTRELLVYHLVDREHLMEEAIKIRWSLVSQRVGLHHWVFVKLHDLRVRWN